MNKEIKEEIESIMKVLEWDILESEEYAEEDKEWKKGYRQAKREDIAFLKVIFNTDKLDEEVLNFIEGYKETFDNLSKK